MHTRVVIRVTCVAAFAAMVLCATVNARADNIYVTNINIGNDTGTIGEYTTAGATVNAALVSGLSFPQGIAVSGGVLFVANEGNGTIGEYTTAGATVNAALVSGLNEPEGIAVSGGDLFVTSSNNGTIGEYTTAGATVNAALVSGLNSPFGIAIEVVPEPATFTLFGSAMLLLSGYRWQQRRRSAYALREDR